VLGIPGDDRLAGLLIFQEIAALANRASISVFSQSVCGTKRGRISPSATMGAERARCETSLRGVARWCRRTGISDDNGGGLLARRLGCARRSATVEGVGSLRGDCRGWKPPIRDSPGWLGVRFNQARIRSGVPGPATLPILATTIDPDQTTLGLPENVVGGPISLQPAIPLRIGSLSFALRST
jgi:hypothetical protein